MNIQDFKKYCKDDAKVGKYQCYIDQAFIPGFSSYAIKHEDETATFTYYIDYNRKTKEVEEVRRHKDSTVADQSVEVLASHDYL